MTAKLILTDIAFLSNLHKMLKTFMSKFILPTPDFPWYTSIFVHMCLFTSVFYLECFSKSINKSKFHIFFYIWKPSCFSYHFTLTINCLLWIIYLYILPQPDFDILEQEAATARRALSMEPGIVTNNSSSTYWPYILNKTQCL